MKAILINISAVAPLALALTACSSDDDKMPSHPMQPASRSHPGRVGL